MSPTAHHQEYKFLVLNSMGSQYSTSTTVEISDYQLLGFRPIRPDEEEEKSLYEDEGLEEESLYEDEGPEENIPEWRDKTMYHF